MPTENQPEDKIVALPLASIRPNPSNPRHIITEQMIDNLAGSIGSAGLSNPLKVRNLTETEKQADPNHSYEVVSGHIRLLAMQRLGWSDTRAIVLNLTPERALLEAILDNRGQVMSWFDLYQSIESLLAINPNMNQEEVGKQLEVSRSVVSRAQKLLKLLNLKAREQICQNLTKSGDFQIPENPVYALTDLATGGPDDPNRVEAALRVVIERKMTEPQTKKLVAWVKQGNNPEDFPADGKIGHEKGVKRQSYDPNDPQAELWKNLPRSIKVHKTPKGYQVSWTLSAEEAAVAIYGGNAFVQRLRFGQDGYKPDPQYDLAMPKLMAEARQKAIDAAAKKEAMENQAKAKKAEAEAKKLALKEQADRKKAERLAAIAAAQQARAKKQAEQEAKAKIRAEAHDKAKIEALQKAKEAQARKDALAAQRAELLALKAKKQAEHEAKAQLRAQVNAEKQAMAAQKAEAMQALQHAREAEKQALQKLAELRAKYASNKPVQPEQAETEKDRPADIPQEQPKTENKPAAQPSPAPVTPSQPAAQIPLQLPLGTHIETSVASELAKGLNRLLGM